MMKFLKMAVLLSLLLLCSLLPAVSAQAAMGVRNEIEVDFTLIPMDSNATVANVLDWLDDFLHDEVGYTLQAASNLGEMYSLFTSPPYANYESDKNAFWGVLKTANDLNSEMRFYSDKLSYAYERCLFITSEIISGRLTPQEQKELLAEKNALEASAETLRISAVSKVSSWTSETAALIGRLDSTQNGAITAIRNAASAVLLAEATDRINAEGDPNVTVISDKEIAFSVQDADGNRRQGVRIVVKTKDHQVERSAYTNSNGAAVFWFADFKPDADGEICVDVTYEGSSQTLQNREFGLMDMRGGGIFHTLLSKDDGKPYLIRATFDNRDMLTIKNGMYVTPGNDIDHTIAIKADCKGQARKLDVWQYLDDWERDYRYLVQDKINDNQLYSYTKRFVQKGHKDAFEPDRAVYITLEGSNRLASVGGGYDKHKAAHNAPKAQHEAKEGKADEKDMTLYDALGFSLPKDWPIIGGAAVKFPFATGFEFFYETGKSLKLGYNWRIKPKALSWKSEDMKTQLDRLKEESKSTAGALSKIKNGISTQYAAHKKEKFLSTSKATVTPYLYIYLERDPKTEVADGSITAGIIFAYNYQFTNQFMIGPVPAFVGMDFRISLNIGLGIGAAADVSSNYAFSNIRFSGKTGFLFNPHVEIGLTVGAGLPRLAYVALRGCGWLDLTTTLGPNAPKPKVEVGLRASVTVKLLFFSKTWKLWEHIWPEAASAYQAYSFATSLANGDRYDLNDFVTAEQANAIGGNYAPGLPAVIENATEENEIQQMPATGVNIKYASFTNGNQTHNVALWLGTTTINGVAHTRVLYKTLGDPNNAVKTLPMPATSGNDYHVVDFDFDYTPAKLGTFIIHSPNPDEPLNEKATEEEVVARLLQKSRDHSGDAAIYQYDFANQSFVVDGTNHRSYQWVGYTPRARFLRDMEDYLAVSATEVYLFAGKPAYRVMGGILQEYKVSTTLIPYGDGLLFSTDTYHMPDVQVMDVCFGKTPVIVAMAQSKADKTITRLVINSLASNGGEVKLDIKNANFNTILPIREKYNNGGKNVYQFSGFMLLKSSADSGVGNGSLSNQVSIAYFDPNRKSDPKYDNPNAMIESLKKFVIKDMGVTVSADGLRTVNVNVNGENQLYAYWIQGFTKDKAADKNNYTEQYSIMASLIDTKKRLATPTFEWVKLQKKAARIHIMPVDDISKPVSAYYAHAQEVNGKMEYGMQRLTFPLSTGIRLHAFSTEYPVVCQGKPFNMYFRFENTGSLVVRSVDIDVIARKVSGSGANEIPLKGIHINLDETNSGGASANNVTHYDFAASGQPDPMATGEHTVYQLGDIMDAYNGKRVTTAEYNDWSSYITLGSNAASPAAPQGARSVETLPGLLPGNIVTFKSPAIISPTTWHGNYTLSAEIKKINFTLSMGGMNETVKPVVYSAEKQADGSFAFTVLSGPDGTPSSAPILGAHALLSYYSEPPAASSDAGIPMGNAPLNSARNDTRSSTDTVFADIDYNDIVLSVDPQLFEGKEYVLLTLSNDAYPNAPESIPKLVASVDGVTTYSHIFKTDLKGGYNRSLFLPLETLTGGRPYEELKLNVTSASGIPYYEVNDFTTKETLRVSPDFFFTKQPADQTVLIDQPVTFTVAVAGGSGNFTYQWQQRKADGSYADILGATGPAFTIDKAPLLTNGYAYWCMVTDTTLKQKVMSEVARLTVLSIPPITGDVFLVEWAALALASSAALAIFLLRRRRSA